MFVARRILTDQLRPCSQAIPGRLWILPNAWLKKDKKTLSMWIFLGVSRQWVGCKFVCSGGTPSESTTIRQAVICNFDLTYLPCCLHLHRFSLWQRTITRRQGTVLLTFNNSIVNLSFYYLNWNKSLVEKKSLTISAYFFFVITVNQS
jgi:hypothetical protein